MRQSLIKVVRDDQVNLVSPGQLLSNFYSNHKKIKNIRNDEDIICNSRFVQEILVGNGASTSANMFENPDRANNDGDSRVNADEGEVSSMVEFKRNHTEQSGSKARLKSKIKNRRILSRYVLSSFHPHLDQSRNFHYACLQTVRTSSGSPSKWRRKVQPFLKSPPRLSCSSLTPKTASHWKIARSP